MARIRSIKPDIRRSITVGQWPREVRLAFVYLWMYLDDDGRGLDDMRLLVAELFPLDRDVTEKKMDRWIDLMATTKTTEDDTPPLCRYEVAGQRYLHATKWTHQRINRPQPSRIPQCPVHESGVNGSVNRSRPDSVNDSLSDSPPSRAPADQGREQGAGSREQGGAESPTSDEPHTPTDEILDQHLDQLTATPSSDHTAQTRAAITALLGAGRPPAAIAAGLGRMRDRSLSLSMLPTLVDEAIPPRNAPAAITPEERASWR